MSGVIVRSQKLLVMSIVIVVLCDCSHDNSVVDDQKWHL